MKRGSEFHRLIDAHIKGGATPIPDGEMADMVAAAAALVDYLGGREMFRAEIAFAWDPMLDDAIEIQVVDRDYSAYPHCMCGTADIVWLDLEAGLGFVSDWKSGDGSKAGDQLRCLAMMLARTYGLSRVDVESWEVSASGVNILCRESLDEFAIDGIAAELQQAFKASDYYMEQGYEVHPNPGSHCADMYCPAVASCPAVHSAISQTGLVQASELTRKFVPKIESPEHAAWLLDMSRAVTKAAYAVKDAVTAAMPEGGYVMTDGTRLYQSTRNVQRLDVSALKALAKARGATDADIESCTRRVQEPAGIRMRKAK